MAERIEDITINYEEDGEQVVKELDKEVLTKGAWTTILFRYQQLDRKTGDWGKTQYSIRRYRKVQGEYRSQSKFNISSADQAKKIIETLTLWLGKEEQA
ncbi:hypothetical protein [Desulfocurvibacter africanus]|uniref:hypothetical protein n=1 Tax=Desulfocurvibacter africanus TaxID=873 RepID=UPI00040A226C|nr:hypothetical protein [Desulfocurvibacter africanus]